MQLFHSKTSPFVRKVMVVLHETRQMGEVTLIPANVSPITTGDAALAHNPVGKIPVLVREEGPALYDSRVICRYLNARAGGSLYPEERIWDVLTLEATADGLLDAALLMVYETRVRPEDRRSDAWVEGQWGKVVRSLDALEARWLSHLGGPLHMGQIAVGCALGYLDFRHGDRNWRGDCAGLARWYGGFAERASMAQTRPDA